MSDDECATGFCSPVTQTCKPGTITPRYVPDACEGAATGARTISTSTVETTNSCAAMVTQSAGPPICLLRYSSFELEPSVTFRVTGGFALAIVTDTSLTVAGVLDVSADDSTDSGPGGDYMTSGGAPSNTNGAGGGGAGFKTNGGAGGDSNTNGGANNGGAIVDAAAAMGLLPGASGGGSTSSRGGYGGGGVTLVSCRGTVSVTGIIDAGGGGGAGGNSGSSPYGGAGGGAGGNVVLQGRMVTVTGQVFANGGAGGSGKPFTTVNSVGVAGTDGMATTTCALGGTATDASPGGDGGCAQTSPTNGIKFRLTPAPPSAPSGGGGGGSVGYFRAFTPAGVSPTLTPAAASPTFEAPGTVDTH